MADVILSTKIKSEYVALVLEVFNAYAESTIGYSVMKNNPTPPMMRIDNFNFKYPVKVESETDKQFAERVIKELITNFVKCYKLGQDTERNRLEHNAILLPVQNVPEIIG